ncbi:MAG TPA: hypothetical protein VLA60_02620 [Nitrospirales bacterium]|nr:hypothetical protein [Nitrospirales bacterium]
MSEGAQIGKPHPTAGELTKVFVTPKHYQQKTPDLIKRLQDHVLQEPCKIAVSLEIEVVPSLPKIRSDKNMSPKGQGTRSRSRRHFHPGGINSDHSVFILC